MKVKEPMYVFNRKIKRNIMRDTLRYLEAGLPAKYRRGPLTKRYNKATAGIKSKFTDGASCLGAPNGE